MRGDQAAGEGGVAQGGRPDDGSRCPCGEDDGDRLLGPQATRHLDGQSMADRFDHVADHRGVCRLPAPGPVEVDHVQPASSGIGEPGRDRDGVVRERRLPCKIALTQPDDAPAPQVDRRQDLEAACHRRVTVVAF